MKYDGILLLVKDLERSRRFYHETLGLSVMAEWGGFILLESGVALGERKAQDTALSGAPAADCPAGCELHFEQSSIEVFAEKLTSLPAAQVCRPLGAGADGRKRICFYSPDGTFIQVREPLKESVARFASSGLAPHEIAKQMKMPLNVVLEHLSDYS